MNRIERNCEIIRFEKLNFFFINAKKNDEIFFVSASSLSKDLFSERAFDILCTLKNKNELKITALLNIDNSEHAFIDKKFARKVCDILNISSQELVKAKFIRKYDEKTDVVITHVIYFILIVKKHRKN